jgi:glyoxylase-like metal-dependent hydrolase (beta-lactamase superfamily II)
LHADHSGLAPDFISGANRILVGEHDRRLLEKLPVPATRLVWNDVQDTLAGIPPEEAEIMIKLNPAIRFAPLQGARYTGVMDGEILRFGGYSLRCILTPGHTPGHI